jgi:hypothetical protein
MDRMAVRNGGASESRTSITLADPGQSVTISHTPTGDDGR